jgi:hypothetical protein
MRSESHAVELQLHKKASDELDRMESLKREKE